ncbi:MAG: hypothetical protein AB2807_05405 [Candidatus Sedimenticola endophacoides]
MKYLQTETVLGDSECSDDAIESSALIELRIHELQDRINALAPDAPREERYRLILDRTYALLQVNRFEEAWEAAHAILLPAIEAQLWMHAVECCDILFQAERDDSIKALAHGIWLGVTFPVDPELSIAMLQHLIDESPNRSDGAAVAAAAANYIVDLRAEGERREQLKFFAAQLLGSVARRHSQVEEQDIFDFWVQQLELDDPVKFLPRLAKVLDIITGGDWWFDRDALRAQIPQE